jgi:hypothetical protein
LRFTANTRSQSLSDTSTTPPSSAFGFDEARRLFGGGLIDIGAEHARPFAREGDSRRLAVSPSRPDRAGADHERDLALETIGHL